MYNRHTGRLEGGAVLIWRRNDTLYVPSKYEAAVMALFFQQRFLGEIEN